MRKRRTAALGNALDWGIEQGVPSRALDLPVWIPPMGKNADPQPLASVFTGGLEDDHLETRLPLEASNTALRRNSSLLQGEPPPPRYF